MRHWLQCLVVGFFVVAVIGCTGQAQPNKNKDLDRPKAAEKGA
jgi:hypothetical protein